jgi:hypothetical protein
MSDINAWWPLLHEQIRRVLANGIWSPVSEFALEEIERLGRPGSSDAYWDLLDGERYLPRSVIQWLIKMPTSRT